MFEMYIEATVRGYHAYLDDASVRIGEILASINQINQINKLYLNVERPPSQGEISLTNMGTF